MDTPMSAGQGLTPNVNPPTLTDAGDGGALRVVDRRALTDATNDGVPAIVADLGPAAHFSWDEFFRGQIRNAHTRSAYGHAVARFLTWIEQEGIGLAMVTPGLVGDYFDRHPGSTPTKKLHLAAIRGL